MTIEDNLTASNLDEDEEVHPFIISVREWEVMAQVTENPPKIPEWLYKAVRGEIDE